MDGTCVVCAAEYTDKSATYDELGRYEAAASSSGSSSTGTLWRWLLWRRTSGEGDTGRARFRQPGGRLTIPPTGAQKPADLAAPSISSRERDAVGL